MGALVGALFGLGLVLSVPALRFEVSPHRSPVRQWLDQHQAGNIAVSAFLAAGAGSFALAFLAVFVVSQTPIVALIFAAAAAAIPTVAIKRRARTIGAERQSAWPDAIDNLASAIRAGLSLPEAIHQLGVRGPDPLRPYFAQFASDYDRTGKFDVALNLLKENIADPTGDRVVESLRLAREVGGGDLGQLLRTLSRYLREDARTRGEMEARQSWTVNAARLGVAAPWFVLLMMSFQPEVVSRFSVGSGPYVLIGSAVTCVIAYRLMIHLGRLPMEKRILQ